MTPVWGFFYGGLINPEVMARLGLRPSETQIAILPGFELAFSPWVNAIEQPDASVYGLLMRVTHEELERVYGQLAAPYRPQAVITVCRDGSLRPALCYLMSDPAEGRPEASHVLNLLTPARALGFPAWYLQRIESFLDTPAA